MTELESLRRKLRKATKRYDKALHLWMVASAAVKRADREVGDARLVMGRAEREWKKAKTASYPQIQVQVQSPDRVHEG